MKKYFPYIVIFLTTILLFAPILINPNLLLNRGNDLTEFFWPIFLFTKKSILIYHQLPFWNNVFFGGTPLLPDPQSFLFYIPNIIFLFLPMNIAFIVSFILHVFLAGVGMYILTNKALKFSSTASLFAAIIYILSPKLSAFLEAGHFGLVTSWTYLPFIIFLLINLIKKPQLKTSILLSLSLVGLFFSHLPTFLIFTLSSFPFVIYFCYSKKIKLTKVLFWSIVTGVITFIISSPSLIPQLKWQSQTTRQLLLNEADVYPKWNSKLQFLVNSIIPVDIQNIDTEKIIPLGLIVFIFSIIGFLKLEKKYKIATILLVLPLLLISLNNASPIYNLLLTFDPFVLIRVATRFWTPVIFLAIILSAHGFEIVYKKRKKIALVLFLLAIIELTYFSWTRFTKPISDNSKYVGNDILNIITKDKGLYRVFCLNRCIPQKTAAEKDIQLVEGYGTLQQKNYYDYFKQLTQTYFDRYSLTLPPFEIYLYEKNQPIAEILGDFNVKYIVSPHQLADINFKEIYRNEKYYLYENTKLKPRAYFVTSGGFKEAPTIFYSPNYIKIDTTKYPSNNLILSEVYNSNWKAYSPNGKELPILIYQNTLRSVYLNSKMEYIIFKI